MDGDARRQARPNGTTGYNFNVDYDPAPATRIDANPTRRAKTDDDDQRDGGGGDGGGGEDGAEDEPKPDSKPTPRWKKILYWSIGLLVLACLIIGGVLYWLHSRQYTSTDDAYVDAYISQISSRIGGRITKVAIEDYQEVKEGQLLVQLDPRDLRVKLDQAKAQRAQALAQLDQAKAGLTQQRAAVDQAEANVRVAQADLGQARADLARYRGIDPKAVSRQTVDNAGASTKSSQARVDANQQAVAAAQANVQSQEAQIEAAQANLKAADVAVANAELQLSYTDVVAPRDGKVAKRTVNLGDYVNPGQALLAVVGDDRWVTANFKETDLAGIKVGQTVVIEIDACPDHGLEGTVNSFQPGSGQVFSALPAENATGNFVKVVQRIPIKITITHEDAVKCRLSPGMSVVPSVKVR